MTTSSSARSVVMTESRACVGQRIVRASSTKQTIQPMEGARHIENLISNSQKRNYNNIHCVAGILIFVYRTA